MKKSAFFILLIGLVFSSTAIAQEIPIGSWRSHLSFRVNNTITEMPDKIVVGGEQGIYTIDKSDNSIERLTKVNGLTDVGIKLVRYDESSDVLLIAYQNSNIDLMRGNDISNVGDISRSTIQGDKTIYDVEFLDGLAYLSTGIGIVLLDLEKEEISETYQLGTELTLRINKVTFWDDNIVAATEDGLYYSPLSSTNLSDFSFWTKFDEDKNTPAGEASSVVVFDNMLVASFNNQLFRLNANRWEFVQFESGWTNTKLSVINEQLIQQQFKPASFFSRLIIWNTNFESSILENDEVRIVNDNVLSNNGDFWLASSNGTFKASSNNNFEQFLPNGPFDKNVFTLVSDEDEIYMTTGAYNNFWGYKFNTSGFAIYQDFSWRAYHRSEFAALDTILDFVDVVKDPVTGNLFFTSHSYIGGIIEVDPENHAIVDWYHTHNSTLTEFPGDNRSVRVSGAAKDEFGNLWFSNYTGSPPIHVRKTDGTWQGFTPTIGSVSSKRLGDIMVTKNGYIWCFVATVSGSESGKKLVAFDPGNDLENISDDRYAIVKTNEGGENLTNGKILCATEDKDGLIWVGTEEGIVVFYCAPQVFDNECNPSTIIVETDGIPGVLFGEEPVNCIAVDAANRKWVGTGSGAWLLSEDGKQTIYNFNASNSPLLSDNVLTIAIDKSGEVFFGTDLGIISYKSTAIEGGETHLNVQVFPNPVTADFNGEVAIKGLVNNANVKITDINGYLVHEQEALGGQVVWNRRNYNGDKAASGIYLVFSTDNEGFETYVTKFTIIN